MENVEDDNKTEKSISSKNDIETKNSLENLNNKLKELFLKGPEKIDITNTNRSVNKFNDNNEMQVS